MKRVIVFSALALVAIPSFAYSKHSSSDGFSGLTIFLFIIIGILNCILFCKIWGMTNNVDELNNNYQKTNRCFDYGIGYSMYKSGDLKRMLMLGYKEEYKESVIINFCNHMDYLMSTIQNNYESGRKEISIRQDIDDLQKQFGVIGESIPEYIQKLETLDDYYNLYNLENTKVSKPENED